MRRAAWLSQGRCFVAFMAFWVALSLSSCTAGETPGPTGTASHLPTATGLADLVAQVPSPLPSATPTVTDTPMPTATPVPTLTPTVMRGVQDTSVLTNVQLVRVIDGNSIEVSSKGKNYIVRYLGIEAPADGVQAEPFGHEATAKNTQLTAGQALRLEKDVTDTDAQGRLLRYVYTKYVMVNAEMVRFGYAQPAVQSPDTRYKDLFQTMLQEAQSAKRGMWGSAAKAATPTAAAGTRSN